MLEEKNHIDKLFKAKLAEHPSSVPEDIWDGIEDAMPKKLFFRFRFEHMNIYYCSLIVLCFLFSTTSLVYTLSDRGIDGSMRPMSAAPIVDSVVSADNVSASFAERNTSSQRKKLNQVEKAYSTSSALEKGAAGIPLTSDSVHQFIVKDTTHSIVESKEVKVNPNVPAKKIKKTVYVTDYDTIVKIDTLRTKKKRW